MDSQPIGVGRREAKKRATRDRVERCALRLFLEKGFHSVSVEEIADAAEISPRSFFRYFGTKEDVVFADRPAELRLLQALIAGRPGGETVATALGRALMRLAITLEARSKMVSARMAVIEGTESLRADALRGFEDWVDAVALSLAERNGRREPDDQCRGTATMGVALFFGALREWHVSSGEDRIADVLHRVVTAAVRSVGGEVADDWAEPVGYVAPQRCRDAPGRNGIGAKPLDPAP